MRWKTPEGLKTGDKRQVQYFALFPTRLSDGYTVWFERYWAEEVWYEFAHDSYLKYWVQTRSWRKE